MRCRNLFVKTKTKTATAVEGTLFTRTMKGRQSPLLLLFLLLLLAAGAKAATQISWANRTWRARDTGGTPSGPGPNVFSASNVEVLAGGDVALYIRSVSDIDFACAEIDLMGGSLGVGTYSFDLRGPPEALTGADPNVVLGLFLYFNDTQELDIEFSRWGQASASYNNSQYVNQPLGEGKIKRFAMPTGVQRSRHVIRWTPGRVEWETLAINDDSSCTHIFGWSTTLAVPAPDVQMVAIANLWMMQGRGPVSVPIHATLSNFAFEPYVPPQEQSSKDDEEDSSSSSSASSALTAIGATAVAVIAAAAAIAQQQ